MQFVELCVMKTDRERVKGNRHELRHDRDDEARIKPATQQCAERDFALQPYRNSLTQQPGQLLYQFLFVACFPFREIEPPVSRFLYPVLIEGEDGAGLDLEDVAVDGQRRRDDPEAEEAIDRFCVDLLPHGRMRNESVQLRREDDAAL